VKKIFDEVRSLDKRAIEEFHLTEDILMEHASLGLKNYITKKFKKNSSILIPNPDIKIEPIKVT